MTTKKIQELVCCKDVLHILFDLNTLDFQVFKRLWENSETRADDLAKQMKKERSTIYRSLQKLTSCGLCIKTTNTLAGGGYYHTYVCTDTQQIKQDLQQCVDNWYQQMKQILQQFNEELS